MELVAQDRSNSWDLVNTVINIWGEGGYYLEWLGGYWLPTTDSAPRG